MTYTCPVCGYPELEDPPENHEICPSCGTQFGYHDFTRSHAELRARWLERGAAWHSRVDPPPPNRNPYQQLFEAGLGYGLAAPSSESKVAMVDLGTRETVIISNDGSFTANMRGRVIALGHYMPNLPSVIRHTAA